ncbi:uncharacterized protein SCHCODRAFT_02216358 [Schizophyllum commune H4-8]|uniref:uncharacterized protein n=1 Tax=Schizophyllum commune (strain H4-8 / FGSC 9210) TaxID=578458 RepID=UPI002160B1A7|nr:uncharacterized protein SCHCODRAFT_02216358 [Schizophyllum commune H4-8]KAI5894793.1 hypothetical protein SCHCODRAFT_02216358 [Schizophyllum commune H4-8]
MIPLHCLHCSCPYASPSHASFPLTLPLTRVGGVAPRFDPGPTHRNHYATLSLNTSAVEDAKSLATCRAALR